MAGRHISLFPARFFEHDAPRTSANFINLSESNFFDGLTFYDVQKKDTPRLLRSGDPNNDGTGDAGHPGQGESPGGERIAARGARPLSQKPERMAQV